MMLSLKIAFRFHQGCKGNILMSLMSIVAIISIVVGISIAIVALSVINGFEYELNKRILLIIPHIEIVPINFPFHDWQYVLNKTKKISEVIEVNPYINFPGIIEFNNKYHLVYVKSINLIKNRKTYDNHIINFIEAQSWKCFCERKNQIILGQNVLNNLNIKVGNWVNILFIHDFNLTHRLSSFKKIQVQVSGVLDLCSQFDENFAMISLLDAKNYCGNRADIDGIEIIVNNIFYVDRVIRKIKNEFDDRIKVYSWMDTYGYMYHDIQTIRLLVNISVIFIISISFFNIIATLILSIKNKHYDIAILRAMGVCNIFIQNIFLWYGFMMCTVSSILGVAIGVFVSLNLTSIVSIFNNIFEKQFFPKGVYFIDFIPVVLKMSDVFIMLGIVFVLSLLICWGTSFKSSRIKLTHILK